MIECPSPHKQQSVERTLEFLFLQFYRLRMYNFFISFIKVCICNIG